MYLKTHLTTLRISQRELSRRTGINHATISLWLNGKGPLSERHWAPVAGIFGIPIPELKERWAQDRITRETDLADERSEFERQRIEIENQKNPFGKLPPGDEEIPL